MQDKYVHPFTDFNPAERQAYQDSLKYYRDLKNVTDTARDEGLEAGIEIGMERGIERGREEGLQQGREVGEREKALAIARQLLDVLDDEMIALKTGLPLEVVQQLR